ncbi:hypothetical protein [Agaribacterium haliotis]|uniref:hypothetical protein n=1 Tax=Agaribacterium haliotis TaxID=2013869 RepID=UPI000BB55BB4|nr:hypothetical protein [Agaribacterium haliotis]
MPVLQLNAQDKREIQDFLQQLTQLSGSARQSFLIHFASTNDATWQQHLRNQRRPIYWWIGIVQMQMQMGIWGRAYKACADARAHMLRELCDFLVERELGDSQLGSPLLLAQLRYNLKHFRHDCMRGLLASHCQASSMSDSEVENQLAISSYGAAIRCISRGHTSYQAIVQSLINSRPEQAPVWLPQASYAAKPGEEAGLASTLQNAINAAISYSDLRQAPRALYQFCSSPALLALPR